MTDTTSIQYLEIAKTMLAFSKPGAVRPLVQPADLQAMGEIAERLLKIVAESNEEPGIVEACVLLSEDDRYLVRAAVRGHAESADWIAAEGSPALRDQLAHEIARYNADI